MTCYMVVLCRITNLPFLTILNIVYRSGVIHPRLLYNFIELFNLLDKYCMRFYTKIHICSYIKHGKT